MTMFYYRLPSLGMGWGTAPVSVTVPARTARFTVAL